jgi:alkanesulfonate monooxygenase SsuD/methylene tetrahydromethanopterin reductase-like flavin-dependent oxidoreductase (luciferase family)
MHLGLFCDLRNPAQWRRPWADHYRQTLAWIRDAEHLGADAVWLTEHHFFDDGYLPQPLTLAAAIAAQTERVRIGTAIVLGALRHPLHLAEEAAIVDLVSNGRFELGIGAGYGVPEYAAFDADLAKRFTLTDNSLREVRAALDGGGITPPAVQNPFPLWAGYQGPQGAVRAGNLGVGLLTLNRDSHAPYVAALEASGHDAATARMGGVLDIIVADDPEAALERILPHFVHQQNTYRELQVAGTDRPARLLTIEGLRERIKEPGVVPGLRVATPADAAAFILERTNGLPVEHVYTWLSMGGMPDDLVERHLELLFTQVKPLLG